MNFVCLPVKRHPSGLVIYRNAYYDYAMIRSWRNAATRRTTQASQVPTPWRLTLRRHKLKGNRKTQWAMTVNGPWRICFEFRKGDAFNVEIADYHKG